MEAPNHKQPRQDQPGDELDLMLDATLAKYAAVEPRAGLEDRVLANLRAERANKLHRAWWPWSVAAAVAMILVVLLALPWRASQSTTPVAADRHLSHAPQGSQKSGTQLASNGQEGPTRPRRPDAAPKKIRRVSQLIADQPKLDQFPSPQPLSEQEKILATYVAEYPEHAVLIARARSEQLRRDELEESPTGDGARDSEERNHNASGR